MSSRSYLIVTASIGSGHMKAAQALAAALLDEEPQARVTVVDFTRRDTAWVTWFMKAVYLKMLHFVPNLYQLLYRFTGYRQGASPVQKLIAALTKRNMRALVRRYAADVVICTHPFPEGAASCLKESGEEQFFFATVLTDYSVHRMWFYPGVDAFFVATERMRRSLLKEGCAAAAVHSTGIPILPLASALFDRAAIRKKFCLSDVLPTILVMGGGLGLGDVAHSLEKLEDVAEELQILVVAGKNERLLAWVETYAARSHHVIRAWGYTDEVPELMAVAALLISKPGALTISEAWAMGVPLILHEPIPGPELENAMIASERGTAVWLGKGENLAALVTGLLGDESRLRAMREAACRASRPDAAKEIALFLQTAAARAD